MHFTGWNLNRKVVAKGTSIEATGMIGHGRQPDAIG